MLINLALDCMIEVQAAALSCGIKLSNELLDQAMLFPTGWANSNLLCCRI
jgi:hypothetical protein